MGWDSYRSHKSLDSVKPNSIEEDKKRLKELQEMLLDSNIKKYADNIEKGVNKEEILEQLKEINERNTPSNIDRNAIYGIDQEWIRKNEPREYYGDLYSQSNTQSQSTNNRLDPDLQQLLDDLQSGKITLKEYEQKLDDLKPESLKQKSSASKEEVDKIIDDFMAKLDAASSKYDEKIEKKSNESYSMPTRPSNVNQPKNNNSDYLTQMREKLDNMNNLLDGLDNEQVEIKSNEPYSMPTNINVINSKEIITEKVLNNEQSILDKVDKIAKEANRTISTPVVDFSTVINEVKAATDKKYNQIQSILSELNNNEAVQMRADEVQQDLSKIMSDIAFDLEDIQRKEKQMDEYISRLTNAKTFSNEANVTNNNDNLMSYYNELQSKYGERWVVDMSEQEREEYVQRYMSKFNTSKEDIEKRIDDGIRRFYGEEALKSNSSPIMR